MGRDYTITNVQRRDEWLFNGNTMQDYAIALQGEEGWIKLTQKLETQPPQIGDTVHGKIETKRNTNGTSYRKFKKVNPNFGGNRRESAPADSPKLDYIVQMLEELTGRRAAPDVVHEVKDGPLEDPFEGMGI